MVWLPAIVLWVGLVTCTEISRSHFSNLMYSKSFLLLFRKCLAFPEVPYHSYYPLRVSDSEGKLQLHLTPTVLQRMWFVPLTVEYRPYVDLTLQGLRICLSFFGSKLDLLCWSTYAELSDCCLPRSSFSSGDGPSGDSVILTSQVTARQIIAFCVWVAALKKPKWTQTMRRKKPPPPASCSSSQGRHQHPHGSSQPTPHFV